MSAASELKVLQPGVPPPGLPVANRGQNERFATTQIKLPGLGSPLAGQASRRRPGIRPEGVGFRHLSGLSCGPAVKSASDRNHPTTCSRSPSAWRARSARQSSHRRAGRFSTGHHAALAAARS
jgi:hypothetical protein